MDEEERRNNLAEFLQIRRNRLKPELALLPQSRAKEESKLGRSGEADHRSISSGQRTISW